MVPTEDGRRSDDPDPPSRILRDHLSQIFQVVDPSSTDIKILPPIGCFFPCIPGAGTSRPQPVIDATGIDVLEDHMDGYNQVLLLEKVPDILPRPSVIVVLVSSRPVDDVRPDRVAVPPVVIKSSMSTWASLKRVIAYRRTKSGYSW